MDEKYEQTDPRHYTVHVKRMLEDTARHARQDLTKVTDARAKALFETSAEVLDGLRKAYQDFEEQSEEAWR